MQKSLKYRPNQKGLCRYIKDIWEKARSEDYAQNGTVEESDHGEDNDDDGHDRGVNVASLPSSHNVIDLTDEDGKKIVIDLTNEDNDGDNTTAASTDHSPKIGRKRKAADGDVEVKTGATAADHKRPRLAGRSDQVADRDTASEDAAGRKT